MEKPLSLRLLYTAGIRGDLALLPRLYTFLQTLKPRANPGFVLLDLGGACDDSVWHCRATGGRSTLVVLDGMGYHVANVEGALDAENRMKLAEQVTMALVDGTRDWVYDVPPIRDPRILVTLRPSAGRAPLQIVPAPAESTRIKDNVLRLAAVTAGQVGAVDIEMTSRPRIIAAGIYDIPPNTPPNPSIAGAVDFVLSEARLFQKTREQNIK